MDKAAPSIDSIFLAALEKTSPDERAAYLDEACGEDVELRRRVERLLNAHPKAAGSFLESPPAELQQTGEFSPIQEGPGTVIGHYKLLQQIGEGGFGVVFMAEQIEPVRRKVALKIIKPGMDTKEVIARFEAERQALALMDHPNIARVFDAGATESGRPYFVMELVRGIPITDYCDQANLAPRDRLDLFVAVCQAVQHAHQKGIIHRDIKPKNVLVTLHDGKPVVKVIDFGIAKATDHRLTERTLFTQFGQMIGTPMYMSPEQAELSGLDVDTRTDIYALGVLLYELLTGATPFDTKRLREAAYDEVRRIIREEEPPMPSKKISTLGEALHAVSAHRQTEPRKLSALVSGDLDWIVMKALEKDRGRRYATAIAFAADVERHLKDEPVEARPPSTLYRLRKFVRRNKALLATPILIAAALLIGMVINHFVVRSKGPTREMQLADLEKRARLLAEERKYPEAEQAYRELLERQRDWLGDDATDTLRTTDLLADALHNQKRWEEASALREQSWTIRCRSLGEKHVDTLRTADACIFDSFEASFSLAGKLDGPPIDMDRARRVAMRAFRVSQPDRRWGGMWALAWVEYRSGNFQAAFDHYREGLQPHGSGEYFFLPLAMVEWQLGHKERARDWYLISGNDPTDNDMQALKRKAASLLELPEPRLTDHVPPLQYIAACDRLLADYPKAVSILDRRAGNYGALGDWAKAHADMEKAAEINQVYLPHWYLAARFALYAGNLAGYNKACRMAVNKFLRKSGCGPVDSNEYDKECTPELVMTCCLAASADVDYGELLQIAERTLTAVAYSNNRLRNRTLLAKTMALFRCGRFGEAIESAPLVGETRDVVWSSIFRAMAHQQLRNTDQAHRLLNEAGDKIASEKLASAQDPSLQILLCEAEALIGPAGNSESQGQRWAELGHGFRMQGRLFDAKDALSHALKLSEGLGEPKLERQLNDAAALCDVLLDVRDYQAAEMNARRFLQSAMGNLNKNDAQVVGLSYRLAVALDNQGKAKDAQAVWLEMLSIVERAKKKGPGIFSGGCGSAIIYAELLSSTHNDEATLQESLRVLKEVEQEANRTPFSQDKYWWHGVCAQTHKRLGNKQKAIQHERIALENFGPENFSNRHYAEDWLMRLLRDDGQLQEAEGVLRKALADHKGRLGDDHIITNYSRTDLAEFLVEVKKYTEAEGLLQQAEKALLSDQRVPASQRQRVAGVLAKLYEAWGKPDQASLWRAKRDGISTSTPSASMPKAPDGK